MRLHRCTIKTKTRNTKTGNVWKLESGFPRGGLSPSHRMITPCKRPEAFNCTMHNDDASEGVLKELLLEDRFSDPTRTWCVF